MFNRRKYMRKYMRVYDKKRRYKVWKKWYNKKYKQSPIGKQKNIDTLHRRYYDRRLNWFNDLKRKPCTDCKQSYNPWQMDFDHLPQYKKKFLVSQSMQRPKAKILNEISKCELVCANCHRNRTHNRKKELK